MVFIIEGSPILYWIVRVFVLMVFIITGRLIACNYQGKDNYWLKCLPLIVVYSLTEGLRWGRGVDYFHYYQDLTGRLFTEYDELLYLQWIIFFKHTGLPFWAGFIFYSFMLICSFLYLLKVFPKIALYALPLFYIITHLEAENLIRQYFALAFIIFAFAFYFQHRYRWMIISFVFAEGIHFGAVFPIIVFIFCYFISKSYSPKRPVALVIVFLFFFFLWDNSYFSWITDIIHQYAPETDSRADIYLQSSSFFSEGGSLSMKLYGKNWTGPSSAYRIIVFIVYLFIIIAGYNATKKEKNLRMCYYCAYIAILLNLISGDIEGYIRLYQWLAFIVSLVVGVIYTELKFTGNQQYIMYFSTGILLVFYLYNRMFSHMFIFEPWGYAFIWDR